MRQLLIEEHLWKPREDITAPSREGFQSFWAATDAPNGRHIRQTAGINPISSPKGSKRRPAVAIFLTPAGERHRLPWLDEVDLDNGFIRYFGDNKPDLARPAESSDGNRVLLDEMNLYTSGDVAQRQQAAPLLFFQNLGSPDGIPLTRFLGFGVIRQAHRVTQLHKRRSFSNYAFDCTLFRGSENSQGREFVDFEWIDARRNDSLRDSETLDLAPPSWSKWVEMGASSIDSTDVRRILIPSEVVRFEQQLPPQKSPLGRTLQKIYDHFGGDYKHGFQALAALTTELVLSDPGLTYHDGWVTPVGPDGGVDFVQRLDLGKGFASTSLVVLGQAKCKKPWSRGSGITAEDLARVVARLRRGWVGAYVTTSYFTEAAQKELIADEYPIVLMNGLKVAESAEILRDTLGHPSIEDLLRWVDSRYPLMLGNGRAKPSDIMRDLPGTRWSNPSIEDVT